VKIYFILLSFFGCENKKEKKKKMMKKMKWKEKEATIIKFSIFIFFSSFYIHESFL